MREDITKTREDFLVKSSQRGRFALKFESGLLTFDFYLLPFLSYTTEMHEDIIKMRKDFFS